jgi:hypothetical protein
LDAQPYEEGEKVLLESKCGRIIWDAKIVGVSKDEAGKTLGYRVHYIGWSSRFDEWVVPLRVIDPSENNIRVQEERFEDLASSRDGLPTELDELEAREFLKARDRARGDVSLPDFAKVAQTTPHSTADDHIFAVTKSGLLAVEAALPIGSVNTNSVWKPAFALQWREKVQTAEGPWDLMRCVLLLEDVISEEWMQPEIVHLRSCLPGKWKALDESSPSALAMRVILLDRGIQYDTVDKKRYKIPKAKR